MNRLRFRAPLLAAFLLLPALARAQGGTAAGYETSFSTIAKLTGDLHHALDRKHWPEVSPAPLLVENPRVPWLETHPVKGNNAVRTVYLSTACVGLFNYMSHAKALDGASRGFFGKAMARLALQTEPGAVPDLQANSVKDPWSLATINVQASYFNQLAGTLVAIEMAHVYLCHYQKHAAQLLDSQNQPVPLNRVISPAEWHEAVRLGARHALDCGFAVDGFKMMLEGLQKMPSPPAWRIYFVPDGIEAKEMTKISRELDQIQKHALL
jgi:hypothetical protein